MNAFDGRFLGWRRAALVAVVAGLGLESLVACTAGMPETSRAADGPVCNGASALVTAELDGTSLGDKQIAFTFDDGPGSRTLELSAYLKSEGIGAAFFVNGHCFDDDNPCGNPGRSPDEVFTQLIADGHIVANHTQDHYDLTSTDYFASGSKGDKAIVAELVATDDIIAPYVPSSRFLFRPPYGAWSARDLKVLQGSSMSKYTGPVRWDIGGEMSGDDDSGYAADWDCWQNQNDFGVQTTAACATRYLNEFNDVGHGVSLMHDADYGDVTNHDVKTNEGNSVDMVKYLVPILKSRGFTFVRLDKVPDIAASLPALAAPPVSSASGTPGADAGTSGAAGTAAPTIHSPVDNSGMPSAWSNIGADSPGSTASAAPDPCGRVSSSPREFPYSAQVH